MTLRREFKAPRGNEFRVMCPRCGASWSTLYVPTECDDCGTVVTFRALPKQKSDNGENASEKGPER